MRKLYIPIVPVIVAVVGIGGAALASASDALALESAAGAGSARTRAAEDATLDKARGTVTFRTQRYRLSDRAVVSTSPTTVRITDPAAINQQGDHPTSLYVEFGYIVDAKQTGMLRVNSGVAIRGYDFVTGTYDQGQVVQLGTSSLGVDSQPLGPARVVGHLNGGFESGIDLDVVGLRLG